MAPPRRKWTSVATFSISSSSVAAAVLITITLCATIASGGANAEIAMEAKPQKLVMAWCVDRDGDGYGDPETLVLQPTPPQGHGRYVADCRDCDDSDATFYPIVDGRQPPWPARLCAGSEQMAIEYCTPKGKMSGCKTV